MTELRLAGATDIKEANFVIEDFLDRFNDRFGVPAQEPGVCLSPHGPADVYGHDLMLQAHSQSGQGQHREVSLAHTSVAAGH